jgi:hypothetical protein
MHSPTHLHARSIYTWSIGIGARIASYLNSRVKNKPIYCIKFSNIFVEVTLKRPRNDNPQGLANNVVGNWKCLMSSTRNLNRNKETVTSTNTSRLSGLKLLLSELRVKGNAFGTISNARHVSKQNAGHGLSCSCTLKIPVKGKVFIVWPSESKAY